VTNSNSTEFTASDGRKFAFPVGTAFLLLSGLLLWRDKETAFRVVAGLGGVLWVAGVLLPARLGPVFRAWMGMAHAISKVTTPIFMGIVYFVVLTPTGLVMRLVGLKPIRHAPRDGSFWQSNEGRPRGDLTRQF
jgi:hypothetical protein